MVHYIGRGTRDYYSRPIPPYGRPYWEFQAVTCGECAPVLADRDGEFERQRLWIFPPEYPHGWTGRRGHPCEVAVFHFDDVPWMLNQVCGANRYLSVPLADDGLDEIAAAAGDLDRRLTAGDPLLPLRARELADRIVLRVFESERTLVESALSRTWRERKVVDRALSWYGEHMSDGAALPDVAATVGYSAGHLRRIFARVLGQAPRAVFADVRMRRARYLLSNTDMSAEQIAFACGYSEIASFSRAFRGAHGSAPSEWRAVERPRTAGGRRIAGSG